MMGIWMTLWVIFMVFAVVGVGFGYRDPNKTFYVYGGYFFLWLSVLILGLLYFGALSGGPGIIR